MSWYAPDWITGYDEENAKAAAVADNKLRAMNQRNIDAGKYTAGQIAQIEKDYASQEAFGVDAQRQEIDKAFDEGWNDGKKNISGFVGSIFKVIGDGLRAVVFGIPGWVWLVVAVGVWGYLGFPGLKRLRGKAA